MAITVKGLFVSLLLVSSAILYSSFLSIPSMILLPFSIKYSGVIVAHLVCKGWFGLVAGILEFICGIRIVISGDIKKKLSDSRPTLIIMNHRCRFDWLFLWCFLVRFGSLSKERITLKNTLQNIPFIGWVMDLAMFIFLHRKWSIDKDNITNIINFYHDTSLPVQLLVFPEGTDLSERNQKKDHDYAVKNGLHVNEYVMHPRTTGFVHCVKVLREKQEFDICDITVGYVGKITQGEMEILKGDFPSEIHFKSRLVPYSEFSSLDEEELGSWLKKTWKDKEDSLKEFYQNKSFSSGPVFRDDWTVSMKLFGFLALAVFSYCFFLYYLPWTLVAVILFGIMSYCIHKYKGGWSRVILNWSKKKEQ